VDREATHVRVLVGAGDWPADDLEQRLCRDECVEVVGCARDYRELQRLEELSEPDVVIVASEMRQAGLFSLARRRQSTGLVLLPFSQTARRHDAQTDALEVLDVILELASVF
jgi:AmiR/NasT family two-component response regulator